MIKTNTSISLHSLLFLLIMLCIPVSNLEADNVSTAEIVECVMNESGLQCQKKTVISTEVSYGLQTNLEVIKINRAQNGEEPVAMEEAINIEIDKSKPSVIFPLTYFHTVAYFPYEEVVKPMGELGFFGTVIPDEYGGNSMGWLAAIILTEEIARASSSLRVQINMQALGRKSN